MNTIVATIVSFLLSTTLHAQSEIEMADTFRQEGKIYVVVAVIAVLFAGISFYLITLERRIKKIEEDIK